jgi:hypothetical protein
MKNMKTIVREMFELENRNWFSHDIRWILSCQFFHYDITLYHNLPKKMISNINVFSQLMIRTFDLWSNVLHSRQL